MLEGYLSVSEEDCGARAKSSLLEDVSSWREEIS